MTRLPVDPSTRSRLPRNEGGFIGTQGPAGVDGVDSWPLVDNVSAAGWNISDVNILSGVAIHLPTNANYDATKGIIFDGGSVLVEQSTALGGVDRMLYKPKGDWFDVLNQAGSAYICSFRGAAAATSPDNTFLYTNTNTLGNATTYPVNLKFNAYNTLGTIAFKPDGSNAIFNFSHVLGTSGIKTDFTAATDLTITTGAAKTLQLATPIWEDLQFPTGSGKVPATHNPTWEALTTNTASYSFTVDDYMDLQSAELPHNWVEGTAGDLHLHCCIKTAQTTGANRYAKFTIYVAVGDPATSGKETWTEVGPYTAELTIPTASGALKSFYLDMGDITLTGYKIGSQVKIRVKRIGATGGTEYADNVFVTQVGIHLQRNTLGSRTETAK